MCHGEPRTAASVISSAPPTPLAMTPNPCVSAFATSSRLRTGRIGPPVGLVSFVECRRLTHGASFGGGPAQQRDAEARRGVVDQGAKPPLLRVLPLRALHPPGGRAPVRRRLRLEERPRLAVLPELRLPLRRQPGARLLERVPVHPRRVPRLERRETGRLHPPGGDQLLHRPDVDRTPYTARSARREPVHVAVRVDRLPDPVDPAIAQSLGDGLLPRDARLARPLLPEPDPQLRGRRVVPVEPRPELRRAGEEHRPAHASSGRLRARTSGSVSP